MVRPFFAAAMILALVGIVKAEIYNIQVWPDDLDKVPCEAWKKNPDGSLTQTGRPSRCTYNVVSTNLES